MSLSPIHELPILLASSAAWRSQALANLGIPHRQAAPPFDEPSYQQGPLEAHVMKLALGKALSLIEPGTAVIGLDQMIEIEGEVLGKPGDFETAFRQLKKLNGKTHRLVNGLAVLYQSQRIQLWDQCFLTMRTLSDDELKHYLSLDQPFGCAGSYQIESIGASLFEVVKVDDLQSVLGLPGNLLINAFRQLGYSNLLPSKG